MLTEEQRNLRRGAIGGSEIGAVAGLSPWARPIDVWRSKVEGLDVDETPAMRRGRLLEPAVAEWYREETGADLREVGTLRHPTRAVALATPDRIARLDGADRVLEIKTAHFRASEHWGPAGTDEVPLYYLAQVAWEMACAQLPVADVAVLIAGDDFRRYTIQRDADLEGMLFECGERFWRDHVLTRRPPEPDESDSYTRWLESRYPINRGPILEATPEIARWAGKLREAKALAARAETLEREARNHLVAAIGDADGIAGPDWRITYRASKGRSSTDWQAVCAEAHVARELIERHTKRTPYRAFRATFQDGAGSDE